MTRRASQLLALLLALGLGASAAAAARPATPKPLQRARLAATVGAHLARTDAEWWPAARALTAPADGSPADTAPPLRPSTRVNDPAGDLAGDAQCDPALARWNSFVVAAWLDGTGLHDGTSQLVGWAVSQDGTVTWTDRGTPPLPAGYASWHWSGSPTVAFNATTGACYLAALADADPAHVAIGVMKGRFTLAGFTWDAPVVACTAPNATDALDLPRLAIDPNDGRVQLVYTRSASGLTEIDAQWADSALAAWSARQRISLPAEAGTVQGPRVVIEPDGTAIAAWYSIGPIDADYLRIARSADRGVTWSAPNDAVAIFTNWGSGAPGDNLAFGPSFPSLAADATGPHAGRLLMAWNESLNWYAAEPALGSTGALAEAEPNDTPATATPLAVGRTLVGSLASSADLDWYSVFMASGQTLLVEADTVAAGETIALRLFATDGATKLAFTSAAGADVVPGYLGPNWLFTAPDTGTYFVRVASIAGAGGYRVRTGWAAQGAERGRDQRDAFTAYSDDQGLSWSTPARVTTERAGFDDWLPEVAFSGEGHAYCTWLDWRQAPPATCGGEASAWLARSDDDGATWIEIGTTTDVRTAWTSVASNLAPNMGTHLALAADPALVTPAWTDGRRGDPDVETAWWTVKETPAELALVDADATRDAVHLRWYAANAGALTATLERRTAGTTWRTLATLAPRGDGLLEYTDTAITPGATYDYRLIVRENGSERALGATTVRVPDALALALAGARPNPVRAQAALAFTLPADAPATLALLDVTGRRVWSREVGALGAGAHVLPLPDALAPGVYVLTLAQQGRRVATRIAITR